MTSPAPPAGSVADWLTDRVLRALINTVLRLPYEKRIAFMGATLRRGVGPVAGYRKRAEQNLAMVYPDWSDAKRRDVASACCDNFGRTLIETYSWQELGQRMQGTLPIGSGMADVMKAVETGRSVLFVSGHFGNPQAPRHLVSAMGHSIASIYRPMQNAYFDDHYAKKLTAWGGPFFAQGRKGTLGFVKHVRDGGMGTLLYDVAAPGPKLPFLGHRARTSLSAAQIALKLDALVVPYFGIRREDGFSFDVEIEAPIAHDTPENMLLQMNARLEAQIMRNPAQWFWIHRRWKGSGQQS